MGGVKGEGAGEKEGEYEVREWGEGKIINKMRRWRDAGSQGKRNRKRSRRSQRRGHEGPVSRKATKSQSGGKPRRLGFGKREKRGDGEDK